MTRKHFRKMAFILGYSLDYDEELERFCSFLQEDNPKFDKARFLEAIEKAQMQRIREDPKLEIYRNKANLESD